MESTYLKEQLAELAKLKPRVENITSNDSRKAIETRLKGGLSENPYPVMLGEVKGALFGAYFGIEAAQRTAERLEVIETLHDRLVSILESLGIELDEETLGTLGLIGRDENWAYRAREIRNAIRTAVADVQWCERDAEHDQTNDALKAAGFDYDEDEDRWTRGDEIVTVALVNGREARYEWGYTNGPEYAGLDAGKSGEFSRLMALIAKPAETLPPGHMADIADVSFTPGPIVTRHATEDEMERARR